MAEVAIKVQTTRPSVEDKFWFESIVVWEMRPYIENLELQQQNHHEALHSYLEEWISREELISRKSELPENLQFITEECQDFEPEWPGHPKQTYWPTWSADMSPPYNPFSPTHTVVMVFPDEEKANAWYDRLSPVMNNDTILSLVRATNNNLTYKWYVDGTNTRTETIV